MITESDLIKKILNINYTEEWEISTLSIAIRNARELSNRYIETGERIDLINIHKLEEQIINITFESNKFLALANYLIIIDLIGNIFKKKNKAELKKDSFKHTLKHFTTLCDLKINSLKNLRNSLAHKFSLGNESEVFILDYSENSTKIIEQPSEIYPSHLRKFPKNSKNMTIAYFFDICNLVENIYIELISLDSLNQLEILSKYKIDKKIKIHDINSMYFIK